MDIALEEIGSNYNALGEKYKAKPFLLAATLIRDGRLEELLRKKIAGIGPSTIDTIIEMQNAPGKKPARLVDLQAKVKHRTQLLKIPGIAAKKLTELAEMDIHSPEDLRQAIDPKSKRYNLAAASWITPMQALGLRHLEDLVSPIPHKTVRHIARAIFGKRLTVEEKERKDPGRKEDKRMIVLAGSYRRAKPYSGDIDVLCAGYKIEELDEIIRESGCLVGVLSKGPMKMSVLVRDKKDKNDKKDKKDKKNRVRQMDVRVISRKEWGTALLYFTGSKDFNRDMRLHALKRGYSLSEYGIKDIKTNAVRRFRTESAVFKFLGLRWVDPHDRERFLKA